MLSGRWTRYRTVEKDVRKAETLPADYYRNAAYFDTAREKVFANSWQFVGDTDLVKTAGQCVPWTALEGYLNEPLLLTRDSNDTIRCLSNVCTHRGNILVDSPCEAQQMLRCGYHGRRFGLDGKFISTPGFEEAVNFPADRDNLPQAALETWSKFMFASIAPGYDFKAVASPMQERLAWLPLEKAVLSKAHCRDYEVNANWALYVENYLEGFHIPYVHPALSKIIDTKDYRTDLHDLSNVQIGIATKPEDAFNLPAASPDFGQQISAYFYWLFPNTMFNFYPWGLSINIVMPLAIDRSRVRYVTYIWDESRMGSFSIDDLDKTEREDEAIVQQVQKGVSARMYQRGRYSPQWETGVHHFHLLLEKFLNA
jgi:choline monooxygenase